MPTVVDTWTGSNGSAWDSGIWEAILAQSSSVVDRQSNAGRQQSAGAAYTSCRARLIMPDTADVDYSIKFSFDSTNEAYAGVSVRAGTTWGGDGENTWPLEGYTVEIDVNTGGLVLFSYSGGGRTSLGTASHSATAAAQWLRVQATGTTIRCRWWLDGSSEPGAWDISVTNSAHTTGRFVLTHFNGAAGSTRSVSWDDLTNNLSGTQTLTMPAIAAATTLFAPTVVPGAVTLTMPAIAAGGAIYPPALVQRLTLPTIAASGALYPPTLVPGAVSLIMPTIATGALYPPTLTPGAVALLLPTIAATGDLYPPTLVPAGTGLTMPFLAASGAPYPPTLAPGAVSLAMPFLAAAGALYPPTLVPGAVNLTLPTVGATTLLFPPALAPGGVQLLLPAIASAAQLYAPALVAGGTVLVMPTIGPTAVLYGFRLSGGSGPTIIGVLVLGATPRLIRGATPTVHHGQVPPTIRGARP